MKTWHLIVIGGAVIVGGFLAWRKFRPAPAQATCGVGADKNVLMRKQENMGNLLSIRPRLAPVESLVRRVPFAGTRSEGFNPSGIRVAPVVQQAAQRVEQQAAQRLDQARQQVAVAAVTGARATEAVNNVRRRMFG